MSKRCFVIQGFGKKQDYEQGKIFNLDASYAVIKEAMEEVGLECYRADELRKNALIEQVMYDQLLEADLVIADITTLNFNAAFELGVRYALRPYATILIGEEKLNFPFDINHIYIHTYQHLGEDIGAGEAKRFSAELKKLAKEAIDSSETDSPIYTFLDDLPKEGFLEYAKKSSVSREIPTGDGDSLRNLTDQANAAMREERFTDAVELWKNAREIAGKDDYIVQQLALATYKSKKPNEKAALDKSKEILEYLKPHGSFDTETLGLWAAVHKRLFRITNDDKDLEEALFALERGFFVKQDYYNGINLAYMVNKKAARSGSDMKAELNTFASYARRKVKGICDKTLKDNNFASNDDKYWVLATLYEASVGLGEEEEAERWKKEAEKLSVADWMYESTEEQIAKLHELLN